EVIITRTEGFITAKEKEIKLINESIESLKKTSRDIKNQLAIYDLEKEILMQERELDSLRVEEHARNIEFINSQIFVTNSKKNTLEADLVLIRSRMKVDKQDVQQYQYKNSEVKREVQVAKIELMKQRTDLASQKSYMQEELDKLSDRYKISLSNLRQIEDWEISAETISELYAAFSVSFALAQVFLIDQKIETVRIELLIQDAKLVQAQALEDAVLSLYAVSQAKFYDSDHLEALRARYKDFKNSTQNMIKLYQDRAIELHNFTKAQYKKIQNIKKYQDKLRSFSVNDVTVNQRKFKESGVFLTKALQVIDQQNDVTSSLSEEYATLIEYKEESLVLINFMLQELDLIGVWHRSNRAVTWMGIKEIVPNLITFAYNVYKMVEDYIVNFSLFTDVYNLMTTSTTEFISYILLGIFLYIIYLSLLALLPALYKALMLIPQDIQGLFLFSRIFAVLCGFLMQSLGPIFLWLLFFALLIFYQFSTVCALFFYSTSIVFLIYISRSFLLYVLQFNRSVDYILLAESFEDRFAWIFSFFSISTITILFFRKMFMLVMIYQQSEFPIILLRFYHIVIFISVVFSIEKNEFLNLIPKTNTYFAEFSKLIDRYYYLLSLFIIMVLILSDPYLGGYGHLMWYIILNSMMTVLLLATMYLIHNAIKITSSKIFFKENSEFATKERFDYAKTWYAIFVVSLFIVFFV
ncbi:MAG: hypothetical protein HQ490_02120, partial [Lutibacter sp.]|nr:hypothetical protein [Lutibacter sp.]